MVHNLEYAIQVILRQDSQFALFDVWLPAHPREYQTDSLLFIDAKPLSRHHVLWQLQVSFLSGSLQDLDPFGLVIKVELICEVFCE